MKIIFSRKGWDSSAGGGPSPTVGGVPYSMPIPDQAGGSGTCYGNLGSPRPAFARDLQGFAECTPCHLDPDIQAEALQKTRHKNWRGAFGQHDVSAQHLRKQGVDIGDIFVFWGLFQEAQEHQEEGEQSCWQYTEGTNSVHGIWGWMEIGEMLDLHGALDNALEQYPWLCAHPHASGNWGNPNDVYIAAAESRVGLQNTWGVLPQLLVLTARGRSPSIWQIPQWLRDSGPTRLSYHGKKPERWLQDGCLDTANRGQEFVSRPVNEEEALVWLQEILAR